MDEQYPRNVYSNVTNRARILSKEISAHMHVTHHQHMTHTHMDEQYPPKAMRIYMIGILIVLAMRNVYSHVTTLAHMHVTYHQHMIHTHTQTHG